MREIKFRGLHTHAMSCNEHLNGTWVYGNLCGNGNYIEPEDGVEKLIDRDTIGQYIGLKDKNGKLIFENDIMEAHLDDEFPEDISRFKIEWLDNGWVVNQPGCVDREYISDFETETYEVCGNTFDNPELLEGGAE